MQLLRHEDHRLITGTGKFTADWHLHDTLHAAVVRSEYAHATLNVVDTTAALELPGVIAILTAEDVARSGYNAIPSGPPITGSNNEVLQPNKLPLLADEVVRFVGQPIAMVVASSREIARDAVELVSVGYEPLDAVASIDAALAPGALQLHESAPGNVCLHFERGDKTATTEAIKQAAHVCELTVRSQRLAGAPMEPRACQARWNADTETMEVYTPMQGQNGMRAALASITGMNPESIHIVADDVGGSFGVRSGAFPEAALVMLAARRLDRPVKWEAHRSELFIGEWHGRSLTLMGRIAVDAEHRITAIEFDDIADLGAYNCYFGGFIGSNNLWVTMGGAYKVPALYMQSRLVYTNTLPVSAYRGAGRPDIAYAIEQLVDHAASEIGADPVSFRRLNFIPADEFPYTTANGGEYDCGNFDAVMTAALELADYKGFPARQQHAEASGRIRGIGFGCYIEKSGAGGAPRDEISCTFDTNGTVTLRGVTGPSGQGHETSFAEIFSGATGIRRETIRYFSGQSQQPLVGNGTGGSRSLYAVGSALLNLADEVIKRAKPFAARYFECSNDDIAVVDHKFVHKATDRSIKLDQLAIFASTGHNEPGHPFDSVGFTVTGANYPNGCHVAEIEIDPETGVTELVNYSAIDDLGTVISPELVRGQVHGGVVQGAGQAFCEEIVYDTEGQLLSGSFMDYALPRAGCLQQIANDTYELPTKLNALGAKGVGESGCSGSLPAIANAMAAVLRQRSLPPIDMPYTSGKVWKALSQAAGSV